MLIVDWVRLVRSPINQQSTIRFKSNHQSKILNQNVLLMPRIRLDQLVVERGLAPSRERARALILAGQVTVDDRPATKAGTAVDDQSAVALLSPDHPYAGRRSQAGARARRSTSMCRDGTASTSARRPGASPTCCCARRCPSRGARRRPRATGLEAAKRRTRDRHRALQCAPPRSCRSPRARRLRLHRRVLYFAATDSPCSHPGSSFQRRRRGAGEATVRGRPSRGARGSFGIPRFMRVSSTKSRPRALRWD